MAFPPSKHIISKKLSEFRHSLSYIDALPQLTLLGFIVGLLTGGVIVAFRLIIESSLFVLLPGDTESFEELSVITRIVFIASGTLALIAMMLIIRDKKAKETGVAHVLHRIHNHQSKLPLRNTILQFLGAIICMISGQSVGREGPAVHLGAGAASQFGQWLKLPNNSINTLVGCGAAAAISASFDTPMAGVIFAMEVLAIEYTIVGFVPVILASVIGAIISKAVFGHGAFIVASNTSITSLYEIPFIVVGGILIAICAGVYIRSNITALKYKKIPITVRLAIAGALSAFAVIFVPQVMGQGYDTVNALANGELFIHTLLLIGITKLILTPVVTGLGFPGGVIGPLLVCGACLGSAFGHTIAIIFPDLGANPSFYVMIGMAGMMAAALNAPLTALVTVLELTYNPNIIFPSMLVIVVSCVATRQLFKVKGIFVEQLNHSERSIDFGPAKQALRRAGVRSVMDTRFVITKQTINEAEAKSILSSQPMWLIVMNDDGHYTQAMCAADLANHLESLKQEDEDDAVLQPTENIDLNEIPSRNYLIGAVNESASLYEAMQGFADHNTQMLYVCGQATYSSEDVKGVLTLSSIENYYKPVEFRNAVD